MARDIGGLGRGGGVNAGRGVGASGAYGLGGAKPTGVKPGAKVARGMKKQASISGRAQRAEINDILRGKKSVNELKRTGKYPQSKSASYAKKPAPVKKKGKK